MPTERTSASGKNLRVSLLGQLMTIIFNFACRRIFLRLLGSELTGFSGLCGHFLNFLSLAEPGFDAACIFSLYRPLAYGDTAAAARIMNYLKRVYRKISVLTFFLGLAALPLLLCFAKNGISKSFAVSVYLVSLCDICLTYLFSHLRILPVADQKSYVVSLVSYVFFIVSRLAGLVVLAKTHNYMLYLICSAVLGTIQELTIGNRVKRMYPYLVGSKDFSKGEERSEIISRVRPLFFHKLGAIMCGSVDNMAVFVYLGLHAGALYSNYTMLSGICLTFISIICASASASVGNLGVTSGRERMHTVFSTAYFAVFAIASFFAVSLFFTYPLIIELWVGGDMVLGLGETSLFCLFLLVFALRKPVGIFLDGFGLFDREKYKALTEALLTLAITVILAPRFGISGVLAGQLLGTLCFSFWYEPYILYKYGFKKEISRFLMELPKYLFSFVMAFVLSAILCFCSRGLFDGLINILFRFLVCGFSTLSVYSIMFFDSKKFHEALRYSRRMAGRQRQ